MNIIKKIKYRKDKKTYNKNFTEYVKTIQTKISENDEDAANEYAEKLTTMMYKFYQKYPTEEKQ